MEREVRWERMFVDQLESAFAECPVLYFAYGLCEPHGPQNALGLDGLKAHAIACRAARAHGGIVAPLDMWHVHDYGSFAAWAREAVGEPPRKWMTAVPPLHHFKGVCYHIRTADSLGAKAAIFLTGHYGRNWKDLKALAEKAQPLCGTRLYGLPDFEANHRGFFPGNPPPGDPLENKHGGDHAGKVETSLLSALEPACSDFTRLPPEGAPGPHFAMGPDARQADRRIGDRMADDEAAFLGRLAAGLVAEYDRLRPEHRFTTYAAVDAFWKAEVLDCPDRWECMRPGGDEPVPPDSVWSANRGYDPGH